MASPTEPTHRLNQGKHATTSNFVSFFNPSITTPSTHSRVCLPLLFPGSPKPLAFESSNPDPVPSSKSSIKGVSTSSESSSGFPSAVRIAGSNSNPKGGGPAFVGQVFSMCDLSGTGLMAVSTHFDIPFISKRFPFMVFAQSSVFLFPF